MTTNRKPTLLESKPKTYVALATLGDVSGDIAHFINTPFRYLRKVVRKNSNYVMRYNGRYAVESCTKCHDEARKYFVMASRGTFCEDHTWVFDALHRE